MYRLLFLLFFWAGCIFAKDVPLNLLQHPPGFEISIYAEVPQARSMAWGNNGILFVGTMGKEVYAIIPNSSKTAGAKIITIANNLNMPNGVAFKNGALYVAEINRILRYDNIEKQLEKNITNSNKNKSFQSKIIYTNLPSETHHGWRYIKFGPDGKLYVSIGMPCNTCLKTDSRFGTITRINDDGKNTEIYAKGLRNSVGFDWNQNHQLWLTDNGRDYLGDDLPPDKLNFAPTKGLNFGFPYFDGKNLPNPDFGKYPDAVYTPPTFELPAHVAALGMAFYYGKMFPKEYEGQIFIAEHGSWNRSKKIGYQVIVAKPAENKIVSAKPFITGWLQGQVPWGRPVDILVSKDGSLLISDDYAGVIYRVTYRTR